jgi:hypothetical protein
MLYKLTFMSKSYEEMSFEILYIEADGPIAACKKGTKRLEKKYPKDAKKGGIYLTSLKNVAKKVIR